jgi:Zn-dependent peptidase ImmA (M78 family)
MHFAEWIAERFELPTVDVPDLEGIEAELAAEAVRTAWGLGNDPAPNMVHLLEAKGVLVFGLAEDCRELDAFAFWRDGRPFVFLDTLKSTERSRFDAAHELGHLVLHRHVGQTTKEHEDESHRFAAAFLLPRAAMLATGLSHPHLADVLVLKAAWQVAATAFVRRLHQVGLVSDWHYRALMIELSKRGYRSREPDGIPREGSRLLATVVGTMRKEGVSLGDIARELTLNERDVQQMVLGLATVAVS